MSNIWVKLNLLHMKIIIALASLIRGFGIIACLAMIIGPFLAIFYSLIPDIKFNLMSGNVKSYTEKEIIETDKESLPLYLKVSDVLPIGSQYIQQCRTRKGVTTLSAIVYPVYGIERIAADSSPDKKIPCHIVIKDSDVIESSLESYFSTIPSYEGKFDRSTIDSETKELLISSGYQIDNNCILLKRGDKAWSTISCLAALVGLLTLSILTILSFFISIS